MPIRFGSVVRDWVVLEGGSEAAERTDCLTPIDLRAMIVVHRGEGMAKNKVDYAALVAAELVREARALHAAMGRRGVAEPFKRAEYLAFMAEIRAKSGRGLAPGIAATITERVPDSAPLADLRFSLERAVEDLKRLA